jgi:hypothetical protein
MESPQLQPHPEKKYHRMEVTGQVCEEFPSFGHHHGQDGHLVEASGHRNKQISV